MCEVLYNVVHTTVKNIRWRKQIDTYSTSIKQLTVLILKTLLPSQWDLILAVTWPTWCKSYEIQLKLWVVRISKKANNLMWFAHIWLDSECLQSYQAITISSWWDQSICDVYKFSGRNVSQVMNNTILSSEALQQQNTTLVQITCELFSIHSRNLLWWLSKIWTKRDISLLFTKHYATFRVK